MGLSPIRADYNDLDQLRSVCAAQAGRIRAALVQLTRQKPEDSYDYKEVIGVIRQMLPGVPVITDDNYAALKVDAIGCQAGADLSTFSCFKILGPEGVGVVLGNKELVDKINQMQYSGGSQVQGHEAMEALRGLTYAPVALAIYAVFILFPLVHVRDSIKFYQNGIAYNGKPCIFQTSKVTWSKRTGAGYFMAYEMLQMAGMPKGANVSYIKDAQELFDGFYRKPGAPAAQERTLST